MRPISSKKALVLALVVSSTLSGCATPLGTKLSTPFGYVNDHPDPAKLSNYNTVKEWAYGVSDGYSSRGTMNRYSLYWGAAIAAGGVGALGGLAATGSSGTASVVIPLAVTFIGTLFGYYQNEELAQVYVSASDSINTFINQSEKRVNLPENVHLISQLKKKLDNDITNAARELDEQNNSKDKIKQDANLLRNPDRNTLSADTIAALGQAVDAANTKITQAQGKIDLAIKRKQNLELLLSNRDPNLYEAGCLNEDVNNVIHRVHVHLALLDPQHVSEDLKNIQAPPRNTDETSTSTHPPNENPPKQGALTLTAFDLSDLDPKKIMSVCDVGL